ncbi:factor-independent urate hydroxylase [Nakamurella endophytica]|uniref:Uricase n=1 Tax=Nakamurella endophytica TaxID=1748367 RepID=A0A917T6J2_9ACTN|nr:urate oxidase [Nakamurella endophytica]GGM11142.1 uricase [Nakamurella endophytica]
MGIVLGDNRYGKAEVRMVHVDRSTPRHVLTDVTVTSQLLGHFDETFLTGSNASVIATDTQKNTVYALARTGGIGAVEEFGLRLARWFVDGFDQVTGARMEIRQHFWDRIPTAQGPHDHSFVRSGGEVRTVLVRKDGDREVVLSGLAGLVVLKSTGSEFWGFPDAPYTSLVETRDRIMATEVTARWRYTDPGHDPATFDRLHADVRATLLERFATLHSLSLQQTLFAMGTAVLERRPEIAEIRMSMPNRHHFLVDLSPWGLDNPNEVFHAADRPYGLIEAAVVRDDVEPVPWAWDGVSGFV